jgi:hypothetical protein
MSAPRPGRFPVTLEPGRVGPGVTGPYRDDHRMPGIMRVIPATNRM